MKLRNSAISLVAILALAAAIPAGSVSLAPGWPQSTGDQISSSPALGDIDGDGHLEIVIGSYDNKVYAWHGDGTLATGWPQSTGKWVHSSPALGDLIGDGHLDVVVGSGDGKVYAWHGGGTSLAGWPKATGGPVGSSPALGDLDGDGHLEVVVGSDDRKVYAWRGDGTAVTGWPQTTGYMVTSSPALGDIDGDGHLEVVVGSADGKVYAWHRDGTAVTGWPQTTAGPVDSSPALGDLNGDGHLDVVVGSRDGKVYAWHGDGTPLAGWPAVPWSNPGGLFSHVFGAPALGDIDGDGQLEVLVAAQPIYSFPCDIWAWNADGTNVTGWPRNVGPDPAALIAAGGTSSPALGDLDGDGRPEVVLGYGGGICAWHGDGTVVADWPQSVSSLIRWSSPALGDVLGNGHLDVVIGSWDHKVYVWDCGLPTADTLPWPMFHHDLRHTGVR
jgi:hypothetical protein